MNTPDYGTLYGIGVGPGAPDLLTLRAVDILRRVDVVLAAASPRNDFSIAFAAARPHLPEGVESARLDFPMTRDQSALEAAWAKNAEITAQILRSGKNAAFLTLGDPLIYSTFGYLLRTLQKTAPELPIEVVPGISSYQAAAAATRTVLCESGENLLLLPGINSAEDLKNALAIADNAVVLKCYKNFAAIQEALEEYPGLNPVFSARLGQKDEKLGRDLAEITETPPYLSLVIAAKRRGE